MTDEETRELFIKVTRVEQILIDLSDKETGLLPALKEQYKLSNTTLIEQGRLICAINARCQERKDCANKETKRWLAIGSGIAAGILGIGEGIKRWLIGQ